MSASSCRCHRPWAVSYTITCRPPASSRAASQYCPFHPAAAALAYRTLPSGCDTQDGMLPSKAYTPLIPT